MGWVQGHTRRTPSGGYTYVSGHYRANGGGGGRGSSSGGGAAGAVVVLLFLGAWPFLLGAGLLRQLGAPDIISGIGGGLLMVIYMIGLGKARSVFAQWHHEWVQVEEARLDEEWRQEWERRHPPRPPVRMPYPPFEEIQSPIPPRPSTVPDFPSSPWERPEVVCGQLLMLSWTVIAVAALFTAMTGIAALWD
jgi:hypothetical protein